MIPGIVTSTQRTKTKRLTGIVLEFNYTKRTGVIRAGDQLYEINRSHIRQDAALLPVNATVTFQVETIDNREQAVNVNTLIKRFRGKIKHLKQHSGIIQGIDGLEYFFKFDEVSSQHRKLRLGDAVEFTRKRSEFGNVASNIICDNDYALHKFCSTKLSGLIKSLAEKAAPEQWDYLNYDTDKPYPLLHSYVLHTFEAAIEQNVIGYSYDQAAKTGHAYFNTGLLTAHGDEIYAVFSKVCHFDRYQRCRDWNFRKLTTDIMWAMREIARTPLAPRYYYHPREIFFNSNAEIKIVPETIAGSYSHLLPSSWHLLEPEVLTARVNDVIFASLNHCRNAAIKPVAKYYFKNIEFALPLYINGKPTVAMVLQWNIDCYRICALVPFDNAYKCARMLGPVTEPWLKPICWFEQADWVTNNSVI